MNVAELETITEDVTFTPLELKFFLQELELRGFSEIKKCIHNARYLAKLERSYNQALNGEVVVKTLEELEAME
ncbi:MAG: hypothetical protein IJS81_07970 [Selenomonadaceae bacterium]|nr:hypothetical protein [Selenomonadaceae bacterium]